jgi:hypothetical protein
VSFHLCMRRLTGARMRRRLGDGYENDGVGYHAARQRRFYGGNFCRVGEAAGMPPRDPFADLRLGRRVVRTPVAGRPPGSSGALRYQGPP